MWRIPNTIPNTNTEYYLVFRNHQIPNTKDYSLYIPNTEYYSVSIKSEYQMWIILFSLTTRIPNTKYQIVYKVLEKIKLKERFLFHTRHFVLKICETIRTGICSNYLNTRILFGLPKTWISNTKYYSYSVLRKSQYRRRIQSNTSNGIWISNYLSHPAAAYYFNSYWFFLTECAEFKCQNIIIR